MYNLGTIKVNKWQLAVMLGTPLAIGLGVYVYKQYYKEKETTPDDGTPKAKKVTGDKALEHKKKAAKVLSPVDEAIMYKDEGNNCYRNGKYDEAIKFYDKAIDKCPSDHPLDMAIFYQNRAAAYEMLKKWNKVKEDCTRSIEYNSRYAKAYHRRARANEATNCMQECLHDITATCIIELFQNNNTIFYADRILKETGRLDAAKTMENRIPVLPSNSFVNTYLRSFINDPLQSIVVPNTNTADTPPRGFIRAKIAFDEQRYDDVIPACTEEIESSEAEAQYKSEALLLRGTFHLLSGSFDAGKTDFDAIIENPAVDINIKSYALLKRGAIFVQQEKKDEGLADFNTAEKLTPNNADIYHQRAQILLLLDQTGDSLLEFTRAVELAPHHPIVYVQKIYAEYRLALLINDVRRLGRIINDFHRAAEMFPDCVDCYTLMAQILTDQHQFQRAQQYYEKATKLVPDNPALYVHQAILSLQWRGDVDKAVSLLQQAIDIDPRCELALETLGTVEVQRGNLELAVELFEEAIKYAKNNAEMVHIYSLRNAAVAQMSVTRILGLDVTSMVMNSRNAMNAAISDST